MREIKFRGKRLDNGKWIYGWLATWRVGKIGILLAYNIGQDNGMSISVSPKTVGQFTGLQDHNGKDIYEGDIIRVDTGYGMDDYSVRYFGNDPNHYPAFDLEPCYDEDSNGLQSAYLGAQSITVIGNIHDKEG